MSQYQAIFKATLLCFILAIMGSCKQALTCNDLRKGYFMLTSNLKTKGDSLSFIEHLKRLSETNPNCNKSLQVQGYFNMSLKNYADAKSNFKASLKIDSFNAYTCFYYGMLLNFEEKNREALFYLNRALESKGKDDFIVNYNSDFSKEMDINFNQIIYYIGVVMFDMKKYSEAKNVFLRCWSDSGNRQGVAQYLAAIYNYANNKDSACFFYKKAIVEGIDYINDVPILCQ